VELLMTISYRPITDADLDFLRQVYASTREEELQLTPWSEEEKDQFLQMQFSAQHRHYLDHFGDASFDVILQEDTPIGRLYVDRRDDEIRVVDIALLPEYRGRGIGGQIMHSILDEAQGKNVPVRIHVEHNNPAMHLYARLGFRKVEEVGVYHLMQWQPSP
jgi:ribosomal protein S18 acetylase RimI-like enzyme